MGGGLGRREEKEEKEAEAVSKFTYSLVLQDSLILTSGHTVIICHDYREQRACTDSSLWMIDIEDCFQNQTRTRIFFHKMLHICVICNETIKRSIGCNILQVYIFNLFKS